MSHYLFCANNPINYFDPDGEDWYEATNYSFEYDVDTDSWNMIENKEIKYTEFTSQGELDNTNIQGRYLAPIVVMMEGSKSETLGYKDGIYGYIDGDGAKSANVTVYGPNGPDDIGHYEGFSMTSDFNKFGAIADGEYNVNYDAAGKSGKIPSHYAVNGRGAVDCIDGKNPSQPQYHPFSDTQKNGIFIHSTAANGKANGTVSTGCPLIHSRDWPKFERQIEKNDFKFILSRTK